MHWAPAPGLSWMSVDDEVVVYLPDKGGFVELDASGALLWRELVDSAGDTGPVAAALVDRHSMAPADAESIVEQFLAQMAAHGAVSPHGRDDPNPVWPRDRA